MPRLVSRSIKVRVYFYISLIVKSTLSFGVSI
nr:MAG TPA_asm: hypothetical protein [Caudoviricetes sp.]